MNVAGLPGLEFEGSFWVIALFMAVLAIAILYVFRRKHWL
jgi:Mg2+ and Co2+ transporter CorA